MWSIQALRTAGDVEVVHGGGDNDFVGGKELVDEFVGDLEGGLVLGGVLVGRGEGAGDPGKVNEGELGRDEVAGDDHAADVVGLPFGCKVVSELAGDGMLSAWANVNF